MEETETNGMVIGLGEILLGSGLLLFIWLLSPIPLLELLQWALMVLLPIFGIACAVGLISHGSLAVIWNKQLFDRVRKYVDERRANTNEETAPAPAPVAPTRRRSLVK